MAYEAEIQRFEEKLAEAKRELGILHRQPPGDVNSPGEARIFIDEQMCDIYIKMISFLRSLDAGKS